MNETDKDEDDIENRDYNKKKRCWEEEIVDNENLLVKGVK